jgi:hypothetical protein
MKFSSDPAGRKQASALCNELYALRERLRRLDLLAAPLEAGLKELLGRLTDFVNPYSTYVLTFSLVSDVFAVRGMPASPGSR